MSTALAESEIFAETKAASVYLARVAGKFVKLSSVELLDKVPEGKLEMSPLDLGKLDELTKEDLGLLYGGIASVPAKNFKDKKIAIESILYQVNKMPFTEDPSIIVAPKRVDNSAPGAPAEKKTEKTSKEKLARKAGESFQLLSPENSEELLKSLAPQARELVLILTELGAQHGSTKFSGPQITEKLSSPGIAERLKTKQDPLRIFQYYKSRLTSVGLLIEG
jgi:hypothetical protein